MLMKKKEIYSYKLNEIQDNLIIESKEIKNDILYITEKSITDIYLENSQIKFGKIEFINNLTYFDIQDEKFSNITSTVTLITKDGSMVFNINSLTNLNEPKPDKPISLITRPTFKSGKYLNCKNIKITIDVFDSSGIGLVIIEYK